MTRTTSKISYIQLLESGELGYLHKEVIRALRTGPKTANEICRSANHMGLWRRCSELREMGVIKERGVKECHITGRVCIVWELTGESPKKQKAKSQETIKILQKRIMVLRDKINRIKRLEKRA